MDKSWTNKEIEKIGQNWTKWKVGQIKMDKIGQTENLAKMKKRENWKNEKGQNRTKWKSWTNEKKEQNCIRKLETWKKLTIFMYELKK